MARKAETESSDWLQDDFAYSGPDSSADWENTEDSDKYEEVEVYRKETSKRGSLGSFALINSPATCSVELDEDSTVATEIQQQATFVQEKRDLMLIGAPTAGKHALINSQFPNSTDSDSDSLM